MELFAPQRERWTGDLISRLNSSSLFEFNSWLCPVKPMPAVGVGVEEIRVRTEDAYRIFYVARFAEAVYVLHAFQKKTHKTSKQDIQLGQQRYKQMLQYRQEQQETQSDE